jgi:predicted RNase H-like HicB family nuclease
MKGHRILQFVIEKEENGGYSAKALLFPIFTEGETLDEVVKNIYEAVDCHFDDKKETIPPVLVNFELPALV